MQTILFSFVLLILHGIMIHLRLRVVIASLVSLTHVTHKTGSGGNSMKNRKSKHCVFYVTYKTTERIRNSHIIIPDS